MVGKSVILIGKKAQKDQQMHVMAVKKSRKRSGFVIYSYLKDSAFQFAAVERGAEFLTGYVKGVPFVNRVYTIRKCYLYCQKWYIKG